jgi:hypothetical protein
MSESLSTQNDLLLNNLLRYYEKTSNLSRMLDIVSGSSDISRRLIDWFVTNYAKKNFTVYQLSNRHRFKVYTDYKLRLKSYSKLRFDPFCRHDRIVIPYEEERSIETTIGQLNFFKWAFENEIIEYIEKNYTDIESDMNARNSATKKNTTGSDDANRTRKRREELSISAAKNIRREDVDVTVLFS